MNKTPLSLALASLLGTSGAASAASLEERLQRMEQRMQYLEQHVQEQAEVIKQKNQQITELQESGRSGGWFQEVAIGGLLEVEAASSEDFAGTDASDIALATAEIGMSAQINDITEAEIVLLYEEDDTPLEVDVARIGIAASDNVVLDFGQVYVPFGAYETQMISDPLTLEMGETRETVAMASFGRNGFSTGGYIFNGDTNENGDDDSIDNGGLFAGYAFAGNGFDVDASVGYISDLSDSDALQDTIGATVGDSVGAFTAAAIVNAGDFMIIGEYLGAIDTFAVSELAFNGTGAEPSAFNLEAGYGFVLRDMDARIAVGYQQTDEAVALGLPEQRVLAAFSIAIMDNTALAFEWAADEDYSTTDGGTGNNADTFTTQLAVAF